MNRGSFKTVLNATLRDSNEIREGLLQSNGEDADDDDDAIQPTQSIKQATQQFSQDNRGSSCKIARSLSTRGERFYY